jgi:hypothetical protein
MMPMLSVSSTLMPGRTRAAPRDVTGAAEPASFGVAWGAAQPNTDPPTPIASAATHIHLVPA